MNNLGYCCINLTLKPLGITTNRGMIKKTFKSRGIEYAGELAELNLIDLLKILEWNVDNNISIFRLSSSLFPWMSEYQFSDLPNFDRIQSLLTQVGDYVLANDLRVGFHPGQYCVLPSPTEKVVVNSIDDLDKHSQILDLMGLPVNHKYSLNIHVGGSYGDKDSTLARFVDNFSRLSDSTQRRLVIENDDKASQYSVSDLYHGLYAHIKIPITFDFFHHLFCTGDMSIDEAATLAASTWPSGIRPLAHVSNSRKLFEDDSVIERSHSDYIYGKIPEIGSIFDIELEAKAKDLALIKYNEDFSIV
jgi:UV DNA damage endonuclease